MWQKNTGSTSMSYSWRFFCNGMMSDETAEEVEENNARVNVQAQVCVS
jgi:hypothetical protein